MSEASHYALGAGFAGMAALAFAQALAQPPSARAPNPDSHYRLGPDSLPQEGVPKGESRGPFTLPSQAYPGTQHTYWGICGREDEPGRVGDRAC